MGGNSGMEGINHQEARGGTAEKGGRGTTGSTTRTRRKSKMGAASPVEKRHISKERI